jgi:dipeptidyl aminopeptidase/acylaminoacyl peptidase
MSFKSLCLASALAAATLAAHAAEPLLPIQSFVHDAKFSDPKISPDGKHVAINVRIPRNGRQIPTMTVYSLPDLKVVSVIAMGKFDIPVSFEWISNERLVAHKGMEIGLREMPVRTGEVVAVNLDGSNQQYLYGYENFKNSTRGTRYGDDYGSGQVSGIPYPMNGHITLSSHLWQVKHSQLYDINTTNSVRTLVADIPHSNLSFILQNDQKPRFAYGPNEEDYAVVFRRDDATGEWKQLNDKRLGHYYQPLAFTPDDKEVFALFSPDGGPNAYLRESLESGKRTVVAKDAFGDIDIRMYTARPHIPFAVASSVGRPHVTYIDEKLPDAKLHKMLSEQFPDSLVSFINYTEDGSRLLFSVSSDRDPGSFYLYDTKTSKADMLFANMEEIDPDQMAERRPIRFTARDGEEVAGYLTMPKNPSKKKLPFVVIPHGGPHGVRDTWFFDTDAQFLASRGYAVLQINFRGSGGRGENFEQSGYHQWGGRMMDDLVDGVKWAGKQPELDGSRVCTFGASFGGYASLMLPIRAPELFKCAVGYAGAYDLEYMYQEPRVKLSPRITNFYKHVIGTDTAELARYSPAKQADKLKLPILLVHGEKDEICTVEHADRMNEALIKAGNKPDYMRVPKEGHGFYDPENQAALYTRLEAFLKKHIGQ